MSRIINTNFVFLLFILLLINPSAYSQKGYERGYIITHEWDTIVGLIKDRKITNFSAVLYKKIRFKRKGKWGVKKYPASSLKGYSVVDRTYTSLNLKSESFFLKTNYWVGENSKNNCFLRVVTEGPLSYFYLEFIDEDNNTIESVDFFKKKNHAQMVRVTQGIFGLKRKRLIPFFSDYPDLQQKIKLKELSTPSQVLESYNSWATNK